MKEEDRVYLQLKYDLQFSVSDNEDDFGVSVLHHHRIPDKFFFEHTYYVNIGTRGIPRYIFYTRYSIDQKQEFLDALLRYDERQQENLPNQRRVS